MKLRSFFGSVVLLNVLAFGVSLFAQETNLAIFEPASTALDSIQRQGVQLKQLDSGALQITNDLNDPWPGIHFNGSWNFGDYSRLEAVVQSTGSETITLHCRIDSAGYDAQTRDGTITYDLKLAPGERVTWKIELPDTLNPETRAKLFAMRGKPGGIKTDSYSKDVAVPFDRRSVVAVRPFEAQNGRGDSWILESLVAVPNSEEKSSNVAEYLTWTPDKFFPMIDRFGQFKHADWPGKTRSLEDLRAQIDKENADIAANQPTCFDEFGGWADGPQLEATGAFRTEKIDGVWYLVDPKGKLFWSNGVDCVGHNNAVTPITDREFYFDSEIPTSLDGGVMTQFLSSSSNSVNNYYVGRGKFLQYNFSASNLYLKFGENWIDAEKELVPRRLRSWGLNTIGNWSDMEIAKVARTPYTATVNSNSPFIEGSSGYWGKFVDPFDPAFPQGIRRSLASKKVQTADDPYCIGYFVDNEISWGEAGSLAKAALASPETQAVKTAFVDWLCDRYETIERFNEAWQVDLTSWDALRETPFTTPDNENADKDCDAFYTVICEKYFAEISAAIRETAPQKLYLGCRFAWTNDLARAAAQKYCDVVSYNFYQKEVGNFRPVEGIDKPVIIGEFHFGALDRGMFHTGLVPCPDQAGRAQAYENYVKSALRNPWIVGAHWFQYGDEPTTGRFDGENYQIGLVDVCDVPYPETIDAVRRVGYSMYETRKQARRAE